MIRGTSRIPGLPATASGRATALAHAAAAAGAAGAARSRGWLERTRGARVTLAGVEIDARMVASVLTAFVVIKAMLLAVVFLSSVVLPMPEGDGVLFWNPTNLALDGLVRFDSWWYATIASNGYSLGDAAAGVQGSVAFFPLYPLLVRLVSVATGSVFPAGLIVSNVAFLLGLGYVYALARHESDEASAGRTVFYLAAAPTAIFFMAMYTESLFLLLTAATFYYARTGRWLGAALAGALAAATRNTGVTLAIVVGLEALRQGGFRWRLPRSRDGWRAHVAANARALRPALPGLLAAAAALLGLVAYSTYLAVTFGDPLAFIHVQASWGRDVTGAGFAGIIDDTIRTLRLGASPLAGQVSAKTLLDVVATVAGIGLVIAVLRRLPASFGVYLVLTVLIPLSTGSVGSMSRYVLMLWPALLVVGRWGGRPAVDRLVLAVFLPLAAYFAIVFSHWSFAG